MKINLIEEQKVFTLEYDDDTKVEIRPSGDNLTMNVYTGNKLISTQMPATMFALNVKSILSGIMDTSGNSVEVESYIDLNGLSEPPKQPKNSNVQLLETMYNNEKDKMDYFQLRILNKFKDYYTTKFQNTWKGKADIYRLWHQWINNDAHNKAAFES